MKIKTRFAPSSTGLLHIGNIRTALYSWLFAKRHNGSFVLRIEDTDFIRSNKIYVDNILNTLKWLGIIWDEGPYFQSQRLVFYKNKINEMLDLGCAYKCYCSVNRLNKMRLKQISNGIKPSYDRKCRYDNSSKKGHQEYVIRFKNPLEGNVIFYDQIRGKIIFNNSELDDLIIQRRNGFPTYNFCVVIDDWDMKITHVIRGEDHINNTPRQINILKSLNANIPNYAHVSMVINSNKSNLSKRKKDSSILEYKEQGFFKEAILNYLIKLGWSYKDKEFFSIDEMKKLFSIKNVSKSSSELNLKKLLWMNHHYLNNIPIDLILIKKFKKYLKNFKIKVNKKINLIKIIKLLRNRCNTLQDLVLQSRYFFENVEKFNFILIKKFFSQDSYKIVKIIYQKLYNIKLWNSENIVILFKKISQKYFISLKNIYMSLRIAITGLEESPSINTIMDIIGKNESLKRLKKLLYCLKNYKNMLN
ncbi:glutamate--tRNA ligase [Buchnera aphidicola]|uniref:Glutamate--tRNA ligase n=1 Tax=Buchnera aphidicola (Therioaphis trifolii) TaxID=1241884 RepID=A0A4D6YCM8_9GAMM|nr:glutamate--tRNA ligase [Buchnera aphidicola]QCI27059.1 glutamate--tRNA ligase [Buchnera aphidicola (Therioaphis trifolii)]